MYKASPYSLSENSMNEVETGFFPSPPCIRIANAKNLPKIERENPSKMDVNKSTSIFTTKIFRRIFYF